MLYSVLTSEMKRMESEKYGNQKSIAFFSFHHPFEESWTRTLSAFIVQVINNKEAKAFQFLKSFSSLRSRCNSLIQLPELHLVII